ncbi:hypothetical protein C7J88_06610 [Staphylococcus muscae]|uniref:Uncharacterized protein n=1 Tax=Staphylococcus muscae TaxID=1294 RepID=A0A240C921_9STAP|nr:hypothetical protein [Staphylococcus muscae]AVQ33862.1 hypothetical protein C7J88_06610 [Staphylococcus muscae]PNZ04258.1 hypothetical protein CD131_04930 [Staphylococcus muscae]GGA83718.1 hypothetical protein GCM10007183_04960 [Staphylococcus muscae]SNW04477.1 Uncharacterised protein [Staphylococcus muscae]
MQKLINILVILLILIGMVFFGAKAITNNDSEPKKEQSQSKTKEEKKANSDKDKEKKEKPKKTNNEETVVDETPVYDTGATQEDPYTTQSYAVPTEDVTDSSQQSVQNVQQPDTSYAQPVEQAPTYTAPQYRAPSQSQPSQNDANDTKNEQQTDATSDASESSDDQNDTTTP